jgi:hypothetical protein
MKSSANRTNTQSVPRQQQQDNFCEPSASAATEKT